MWELEEVKPHQKQFHVLTLNFTGRLGGWRSLCQLRMSPALLVSSALPHGSPNFWGSVDLSSSHRLPRLRPVAPNIATALSLKLLLSLSSHRDLHFLLNCLLASYERSVEWTQTFFKTSN